MLGPGRNLGLALINLQFPSGNNTILESGKSLAHGSPPSADRNLRFPSGNNAILGVGRNLILLAATLSPRALLLRQTFRARSGRVVHLQQDVAARSRRDVYLRQDTVARARRDAVLQQDASARAGRATVLATRLRAAAAREQTLRQDLHAFARAGYRLFAMNLTTGQETELGFIPSDGPLTLTDIALADGDYEIRVRSDGSYWRDARHATAFPLSIEDGEIVAPLPPVTNLRHTRVGDAILLSWTWHPTTGTQAPRDFAIWTSPSEPVDTTGEPDQVVTTLQPGGYSTGLPEATEPFHAAIRARRDNREGPLATIAIPALHIPLVSPDNQTAWFDRD